LSADASDGALVCDRRRLARIDQRAPRSTSSTCRCSTAAG